jgi:hypothetical protein
VQHSDPEVACAGAIRDATSAGVMTAIVEPESCPEPAAVAALERAIGRSQSHVQAARAAVVPAARRPPSGVGPSARNGTRVPAPTANANRASAYRVRPDTRGGSISGVALSN